MSQTKQVVGDWIRGQHLIKTGRKEEWMDKSRTIAREVRPLTQHGSLCSADEPGGSCLRTA